MSDERVANWRVRHKSINPKVHVSTRKSLEHKTYELKWVSKREKRHKRNSLIKGHQQQEKLLGMRIWRSWEGGGVQYLREGEGTVKHK